MEQMEHFNNNNNKLWQQHKHKQQQQQHKQCNEKKVIETKIMM